MKNQEERDAGNNNTLVQKWACILSRPSETHVKTQSAHTSPRSPPQLLHCQSRWSRGSNLERTHFLFFSPLYHQISTCTEVWLGVVKEVSLQSHSHAHTHTLHHTDTHSHSCRYQHGRSRLLPPPTLHRFRKEGARHTRPGAVRWISQQAHLFFLNVLFWWATCTQKCFMKRSDVVQICVGSSPLLSAWTTRDTKLLILD